MIEDQRRQDKFLDKRELQYFKKMADHAKKDRWNPPGMLDTMLCFLLRGIKELEAVPGRADHWEIEEPISILGPIQLTEIKNAVESARLSGAKGFRFLKNPMIFGMWVDEFDSSNPVKTIDHLEIIERLCDELQATRTSLAKQKAANPDRGKITREAAYHKGLKDLITQFMRDANGLSNQHGEPLFSDQNTLDGIVDLREFDERLINTEKKEDQNDEQ